MMINRTHDNYFIKGLVIILMFSLFGLSCSFGEQQKLDGKEIQNEYKKEHEDVEVSNSELTFLNRWVDFGTTPRDTLLVARYDFINSGDDILIIRSVDPDCIFNRAYLSNERIAPGDSAYVLLELGTGRMGGYFIGYATIETNTYTKFYNLTLEAFIE
jgi:hypothetical protein